jgi:Bacteriophage baseplate protein W
MSEFVGVGVSFPVETSASGSIQLVSGHQEITQAIRLILGTAFGERPMRPEFGCAIHDLIFSPGDASLAGLIAYEVKASLRRWEPRIDIDDIAVHFDADKDGLVYIDIAYTIRKSNDPRNLVFPFYFIPEE